MFWKKVQNKWLFMAFQRKISKDLFDKLFFNWRCCCIHDFVLKFQGLLYVCSIFTLKSQSDSQSTKTMDTNKQTNNLWLGNQQHLHYFNWWSLTPDSNPSSSGPKNEALINLKQTCLVYCFVVKIIFIEKTNTLTSLI